MPAKGSVNRAATSRQASQEAQILLDIGGLLAVNVTISRCIIKAFILMNHFK